MPEPVILAPYDPHWPVLFDQIKCRLQAVLGDLEIEIEHVGSTAVPGLLAKPIIDLDVVIESRTFLPRVTQRLGDLGYQHQVDLGIADREAFVAPIGAPAQHLYVCSRESPELRRHLQFRDFLRAHAEEAQAYAELKRTAAMRFRNDREAYTEAKTAFITEILRRAEVH